MIIGKKSKNFVEGLKEDRLDAILDKKKAEDDLKDLKKRTDKAISDRDSKIKELEDELSKVKTELKSVKSKSTEMNSCTEITLDEIFTDLRNIACVTSWDGLARVLGISTTQLLKYRKGTLPLNKETQDNFYYLVTKFSKK